MPTASSSPPVSARVVGIGVDEDGAEEPLAQPAQAFEGECDFNSGRAWKPCSDMS